MSRKKYTVVSSRMKAFTKNRHSLCATKHIAFNSAPVDTVKSVPEALRSLSELQKLSSRRGCPFTTNGSKFSENPAEVTPESFRGLAAPKSAPKQRFGALCLP